MIIYLAYGKKYEYPLGDLRFFYTRRWYRSGKYIVIV